MLDSRKGSKAALRASLGRALAPCLLPVLLAAAPVAHAQIYGWVDSNGHFTYSNLPPPKDAQVLDVIDDEPAAVRPSAARIQEAEAAAARDRQRLRELEETRWRQQAMEYAAPAVPMASAMPYVPTCDTDPSIDCYPSEAGPVYILGGVWARGQRAYGPGYGHVGGYPRRGGAAPGRVTASAHTAGAARR